MRFFLIRSQRMDEMQRVALATTTHFLQENYGQRVVDVEPLGAGGWSEAYSFVHDGVKFVIRWSHVADNFERDAYAVRYRRDGLPIPSITASGRMDHTFYAISPFIDGTVLEALPLPELEQTLPAILKLFRALRSVDLSAATGFGFWNGQGHGSHKSWSAFLLDDKNASAGSLIHGWRAKLEASPMGMTAYDQLWQSLVSLVKQCPEERSLVHSDLLNRNVLAASGQIAAVLDWGSSFYGDSLYDVAWFTFYEPWFPHFKEVSLARRLQDDFQADPRANQDNLEARLLCYLLDIGIGSIAYNAYIENWANAEEAAEYTLALLR
jgi:hygromycin-B 4-O-kinase